MWFIQSLVLQASFCAHCRYRTLPDSQFRSSTVNLPHGPHRSSTKGSIFFPGLLLCPHDFQLADRVKSQNSGLLSNLKQHFILLGFNNSVCLVLIWIKNKKSRVYMQTQVFDISWEIRSGHPEPVLFPGNGWMGLRHGWTPWLRHKTSGCQSVLNMKDQC